MNVLYQCALLNIWILNVNFINGLHQQHNHHIIDCYQCSSTEPTVIIGGAGVHPGVYLSTLALHSVPVVSWCRNDVAHDHRLLQSCEQGVCVKIDYVDRHTAVAQEPIRCYNCATVDVSQILQGVEDDHWQQWLRTQNEAPRTPLCLDPMLPGIAIRSGAQSQECKDGVCMKMWFKQRGGLSQVWRTCIPNGSTQIRADCTRISSGDGDMEVCTCDTNLCNTAPPKVASTCYSVVVVATVVVMLLVVGR